LPYIAFAGLSDALISENFEGDEPRFNFTPK
jgi:hypothetical protein